MDGNHAEIVDALRRMGCSVQSLAPVGKGCPDLLVGYSGRNVLLEVKAQKGQPTSDQMTWGARWSGQLGIVRTIEEAMRCVEYACRPERRTLIVGEPKIRPLSAW